mgnify:CR=1 FL=1
MRWQTRQHQLSLSWVVDLVWRSKRRNYTTNVWYWDNGWLNKSSIYPIVEGVRIVTWRFLPLKQYNAKPIICTYCVCTRITPHVNIHVHIVTLTNQGLGNSPLIGIYCPKIRSNNPNNLSMIYRLITTATHCQPIYGSISHPMTKVL